MKIVKCSNCGEEIDPDVCWCGAEESYHTLSDNHGFIPLGCKCFYSNSNVFEHLGIDFLD